MGILVYWHFDTPLTPYKPGYTTRIHGFLLGLRQPIQLNDQDVYQNAPSVVP
jgi:hypothetical protein